MKKKPFIKSLDINKTMPTLIRMDVATPPHQPCAATCNTSQEIEICLGVKSPVITATRRNGRRDRKQNYFSWSCYNFMLLLFAAAVQDCVLKKYFPCLKNVPRKINTML